MLLRSTCLGVLRRAVDVRAGFVSRVLPEREDRGGRDGERQGYRAERAAACDP